jgi:nitroimidazol reductase NimA-like FMN-containing flavoprotein (pyridoxamine 5'-phosphate oxidase superfamily)
MDAKLQSKVVELLRQHRIMTIATLRPDGWPQATTVGYVSEGLTLWFLCGLQSQKARNLALDNRVSITVDHDTPDIMAITGLSMAARAHPVRDRTEARRVLGLLASKYTESSAVMQPMPMSMPAPEDVAVFRVEPEVISVLDYTKGFGHTDLVTLPGSTTEQAKPDKRPPPAST